MHPLWLDRRHSLSANNMQSFETVDSTSSAHYIQDVWYLLWRRAASLCTTPLHEKWELWYSVCYSKTCKCKVNHSLSFEEWPVPEPVRHCFRKDRQYLSGLADSAKGHLGYLMWAKLHLAKCNPCMATMFVFSDRLVIKLTNSRRLPQPWPVPTSLRQFCLKGELSSPHQENNTFQSYCKVFPLPNA